MFREIRRKDRSVSIKRAYEILNEATYGVLTIYGDDGYPYGVPVNHIVINNTIYFHAATEGKKYDSILINNKVGFTAVAYEEVVPKKLTTKYASVIVMGKASIVEDDEKMNVLSEFIQRFSPNFIGEGKKSIKENFSRTAIMRIDIDHITGKENRR